ncbi:MAG: aminoglycoside phosphotransferase (APT) family kinase protein [Verrucomicrobiales bacterium]|jgi:aminoglycoside phosphotransferase (APT) family kinase protein
MRELGQRFESAILGATGASGLRVAGMIQELWSGYGQILRVGLEGGSAGSVVVKHVRLPNGSNHPRGWNSDRSHQRKVKSYQVETAWYQTFSARCGDACRVPRCLAFERDGDEVLMVLEDLDAAGFPSRLGSAGAGQVELCLRWLANFHATFLGVEPRGLWETGTYWHLETRPDELEVLEDLGLKAAAGAIDERLTRARFQTLVHGDAKLANFCFAGDATAVAAVDFQYVGGGCGMKDVAYFIGSCLGEQECESRESELLDGYFGALGAALRQRGVEVDALEEEWRELYPVAWTDFHRFLKGWSPGHWKINSYSERLAREVVALI